MCGTIKGEEDQTEKSGFSIIRSKLFPYDGEEFSAVAYLGRPWRSHATVVIMESEIGKFIHPNGWVAWNSLAGPPPPTVNFGEYRNYGPGSGVSQLVKWVGYNPVMTDEEAKQFTVDEFINKQGWLKETCVSYNGSL